MPPSITLSFRVRHYECDIFEHVNNAIYFRYLQEAALLSLTAAGLSTERLKKEGLYPWLVYTDLEFLQPLRYGDTVEVEASLMGVSTQGVVQSFTMHGPGGTASARAKCETIFLKKVGDGLDREPALAQLSIEDLPHLSAADQMPPLPNLPPAPPGVFRLRRSVAWQDLNAGGQVDPAVLLGYLEECSWGVVAAHGWPMKRMIAEGFAIFFRRHQLHYPQPARLGDEIEVATWASDVKRVSATRHYEIRRVHDGTLIAQVNALGVWVSLASGLPIRIPAGFMEDFAANLAD